MCDWCLGTRNIDIATYLHSSSVDRLPDMAFVLNEDDEDVDRQCEVFKNVCAKNVRSFEDVEENAWEDTDIGCFQTSENESRKWQNEDCQVLSSSDEEEEEDDEEKDEDVIRRPLRLPKADVRMEVDVNDIWSSGAATLDTIADFQNPWGSGTGPAPASGVSSDTFGSTDGGWADFSSFETNFSSSTQLSDGKSQEASVLFDDSSASKMDSEGKKSDEKTSVVPEFRTSPSESFPSTSESIVNESGESNCLETASTSLGSGASFVEADANANPTSCADDVTSTATAMVDEVASAAVAAVKVVVADKLALDNQRFLAAPQDETETSGQGESDEARVGEDLQEKRDVENSVAGDLPKEAI